MARQARAESPTGYYHIIMRGNNRETIFKSNDQKNLFLEMLQESIENQLIQIVAYCLMDNHVHLIIKSELHDLSKAIKSINIRYAMYFNRQKESIGHVFQDRYRSEVITDDKYLTRVIRYVHNNPVKAKIINYPNQYKWSSYNEYINGTETINIYQKEFILGYFSYDLNNFEKFHKEEDNYEYLDTKEDIEEYRLKQGQQIIKSYCQLKGIRNIEVAIKNSFYLEELVLELLQNTKLSHRQIAELIGVTNSKIHKISLQNREKL